MGRQPFIARARWDRFAAAPARRARTARSRLESPQRDRALLAAAVAATILLAGGCASVARITTLSDEACRAALVTGIATTLSAQGETPETAARLARAAAETLASADIGPRPFLVVSPSGTDYAFFVEPKDDACLLRLYGRQKGFVSYTNNLTYIATQPLAPCRCAE